MTAGSGLLRGPHWGSMRARWLVTLVLAVVVPVCLGGVGDGPGATPLRGLRREHNRRVPPPCHANNLGKAGHWSGENLGPKARFIRQMHIRLKPEEKVQSMWRFDCSLPAHDKLLDVADFTRYLQEHMKLNGKTGNLGPRRGDELERPLVVIYPEANARVVVKAYTKVSKRYVKYLAKQYLYQQNSRDFIWCVAAGKGSYKLRYYKIDEMVKTAKAQPDEGGGATGEEGEDSEDSEEGGDEGGTEQAAGEAEEDGGEPPKEDAPQA